MFVITKTFGHEVGLSCAFRQWKAHGSHCRLIHGYSLAVEIRISSQKLDDRNWVFDFGNFQKIKDLLVATFDHKLVIAEDDPDLSYFEDGQERSVLDLVVLPSVGCEAFARQIFDWVAPIVEETTKQRAALLSVTVSEHGANSATYQP